MFDYSEDVNFHRDTGFSSTICRIKLRLGPSWGCEKPTISMGLIIVGEPQKCHTFFACIISLRHIIYPYHSIIFRPAFSSNQSSEAVE